MTKFHIWSVIAMPMIIRLSIDWEANEGVVAFKKQTRIGQETLFFFFLVARVKSQIWVLAVGITVCLTIQTHIDYRRVSSGITVAVSLPSNNLLDLKSSITYLSGREKTGPPS